MDKYIMALDLEGGCPMDKYIMALDLGTTSCRCIIFDKNGRICSAAQKEFTQYFPQPGWVEHDAEEIWATQTGLMYEAMSKIDITINEIARFYGIKKPDARYIKRLCGSAAARQAIATN